MVKSCPNCLSLEALQTRVFTPEAIATLAALGEITPEVAAQPICKLCYDEMRDTLMDLEIPAIVQIGRDTPAWARPSA